MSKTSIKERNKAIRLAWEREQGLVSEGKGTRDWTEAQQKDILDPNKGKAYDDNGRVFEGQHMKSAAEYPEYQGNPDNIQFLTREEHLEAHKGSWQNPTNWYYNPETKEFVDFGENKPTPCEIIQLSDPVVVQTVSPIAEQDDVESARKQQDSKVSAKPDLIPTKNETRETATSVAAKGRKIPKEDRSFGDKLLGVVDAIKGFGERHPVIAGIAKGVGIVGGTIVAAIVHEAVSGNGSSGNSSSRSSSEYYPPSGYDDSYGSSSETEEEYSEPSTEREYPDERSSPREHDVSGYDRQQNGKTVHVNPYKRGGKSSDGD